MVAQQFAFEKNLTYTIYTAFDEDLEWTGDYIGPHFDWYTKQYWTTGEQESKSITWKIGSNSDFDTGIFLDGSPWVKDNGDIHLLEVTPVSAMKQNAFYENFAVNETMINPDLGKAVSSQIGQTSRRCGDNIQGYESTVDISQYGGALKIGKTCIPNKAFLNWNDDGWTDADDVHHDDGGAKFSYVGIDEQTATDWQMFKMITDEDTGGGKGTVAFTVGWDGRGSLAAAPRSAPRDEPPANEAEAKLRGMLVHDEDQDWLFNWQSGYGWQRTSLSRGLVSENTDDWNSDPISGVDHWWTEGNVTRGTKEDGGRLYQNAQENSRPRPGLDPDGGVRYYGTSNTDLLSNVGGCSTAYDKALEYSGEFLDRHGVVRYSGVWDRKPRKLETYDSVLGCNSHYSESGMLAAREEFRRIYDRFLEGWQSGENPDWVIDVSGWEEAGGESPPEGNNGLLSWDYDLSDISYEQSSPTKFSWGNGQPRGSCVNIFASLTVVPDDEESNFTDWNKKFRPPMNWDPTDKPNMPFMEELEDIEEFNLGGNNPNYNDGTENYEGSFQKYYPEVDMDGVQYGWVRQPDSEQYPMTRQNNGNWWKLWDYFLEETWGIGSVNFRPPRFGSTRLLLSPSDQDDSVQGFSNSKANAASEYGSSEAMMQEPTMLLAFDKNVDTDPLFNEMKDHHGLNNTPEELRQRLRRVITQKGIDLYGAYASLGKRVVSNAGHGEPYDWYLFFALGTVDSQGANNSRDKIKHIYEGNIGNVANGTYTTTDTEAANSMDGGNGYGSYSSSLYAIGPQLGVQWNINNSSVDALPGPTTGTWGETHPTGGVLHGARIHSVIAKNVGNHTLPDPGEVGGPTNAFAWGTPPDGTPTNSSYQTLTIHVPLPTNCGGGYGSGYDEDTGEWETTPSGVEGLMQLVNNFNDNTSDSFRKIRPIYDEVINGNPIPHDKLYYVNGYDTYQSNRCAGGEVCECCNWSCSAPSEIFGFKTTRQGKGLWNMAINRPPYFATNKFIGFYVRNRRTNKITRIVSQGVDRAPGECASAGDTLKGLIYPTNMSIVLTLQENIDIQENEKVDLIPASVQDIDSGYAVFNDTGEMSSMIGLGNYDYVFTRGQGTVALITRLLAWSDSSIPNSVAGIRDALPTYWKFIYDKSIGFSTYEPLRFKGFTSNYGASKLLYVNSGNAPANQSGVTVSEGLGDLANYTNPELIQWKDIGWPTLFRAFIRSLLVDQLDKPIEMAHFYNDVLDHIYRWPSCSNDTSVDVCNTSSLGTIGAVITDSPSYQGPQHVHVDDVEGNQISSLDSNGDPRLCFQGNQCDPATPPTNLADGIEFYRVSIPRDVADSIAEANLEELLGDCSNCTKTLEDDWKDYKTYDAVVLSSRKTNYNDKDGEYSINESLDYSYVDPSKYKLHVWIAGTNKPVEMKLIAEAKTTNHTENLPQAFNWTQIWALPPSIKYAPHLYAKYRGSMAMTHFFATC